MNHFTLISLFPELIEAYLEVGVVGRANQRGIVNVSTLNPRDYAPDRRGTVDDAPYGGGPGMVMMVAPLRAAIADARARMASNAHVIYLSPQGRTLDQGGVEELAGHANLVLVAGRYEGVDERLLAHDIDSEWSVGDFVVSGGELPALVMLDAIVRLLPGTLGDAESAISESFSDDLLDFPHYTRPESVDNQSVPAVLLGGNHQDIARWRRKQRLGRTYLRRPDLLAKQHLDSEDRALLAEFVAEQGLAPRK